MSLLFLLAFFNEKIGVLGLVLVMHVLLGLIHKEDHPYPRPDPPPPYPASPHDSRLLPTRRSFGQDHKKSGWIPQAPKKSVKPALFETNSAIFFAMLRINRFSPEEKPTDI
jgi:hypothetical protein